MRAAGRSSRHAARPRRASEGAGGTGHHEKSRATFRSEHRERGISPGLAKVLAHVVERTRERGDIHVGLDLLMRAVTQEDVCTGYESAPGMTERHVDIKRKTVAALDIAKALRQDKPLRTRDDIVRLLQEEYTERHQIPKPLLFLETP